MVYNFIPGYILSLVSVINYAKVLKYVESRTSPTFSGIAVVDIIPQFMQQAREVGVSQALEEFEAFLGGSDR